MDEEGEEGLSAEPAAAASHGALPAPPAWVRQSEHWLPAQSPASLSAAVPAGSEQVTMPTHHPIASALHNSCCASRRRPLCSAGMGSRCAARLGATK